MNELIAVFGLVVSTCALRALLATLKMTKRAVKAARRAQQPAEAPVQQLTFDAFEIVCRRVSLRRRA